MFNFRNVLVLLIFNRTDHYYSIFANYQQLSLDGSTDIALNHIEHNTE